MFRFRSITRPLQRAVSASPSQCARQISTRRPQLLASSITMQRFPRFSSAFSTSVARWESDGQVNAELAAKLTSELSLEQEMRDSETMPEHLKEFLDNTPFELHDKPGSEEVTMTRKYGDETIRVAFSIADLNNVDEDADLHDTALEDEFDEGPASVGGSSKGAVNQGGAANENFKVAPEDSVAESDHPESDQHEGLNEPSFPARLFVTVERPSKGSLQVEAIAQDGLIVIDNIYFFKDSKLVEPNSNEDQRVAERLYTGPPFGNLDEDLQVLFENYLSERGINTTMALFVPEFIDYKEQKEYLSWLQNVKAFVE